MAMAMAMSVPCAARGYGCGDRQRLRISSSNSRFAVSAPQCGTITRSTSSCSSILSKNSKSNTLEAALASFTLGGAPGFSGYGGIYPALRREIWHRQRLEMVLPEAAPQARRSAESTPPGPHDTAPPNTAE